MILVTAGAGYIGSHSCVELLNAGHEIVVFDDFSNSHLEALRRVQTITGKTLQVVEGDIRCQAAPRRCGGMLRRSSVRDEKDRLACGA